jgi:aminocarboxymuconate-semialdehyde decarboxylase
MPVDVHAHYVPLRILERLRDRGGDYGVSVVDAAAACPCLEFEHGLRVRPFFARLLEKEHERIEAMERIGMDRQVLSLWTDIFGYGMPADRARAWHRLLNDALAETVARHPGHFSWFASGPLPDASAAARELERAVRQTGAVGGVVGANVAGENLGELPLDEYWSAAVELDVPVFIHPVQAEPLPRTRRFGLNTIAQYGFDTTLTIGSLIFSGVLDRFRDLKIIASHGGGMLPYLIGRFDCMHERMDRREQGNVAQAPPSAYLRRFHYDTILHDPAALRYLAGKVDTDRLVLGSDDPFPPMDKDPLASLRLAGFTDREMTRIADENPRRLLRL